MAITKIEEIHLYCSESVENSVENIQAMSFMDHSGIPYTKLTYNDPAQHASVMESINGWIALPSLYEHSPITKFPFLVYTEIHDDIPARSSPLRFLEGIEAIQTFQNVWNTYNPS